MKIKIRSRNHLFLHCHILWEWSFFLDSMNSHKSWLCQITSDLVEWWKDLAQESRMFENSLFLPSCRNCGRRGIEVSFKDGSWIPDVLLPMSKSWNCFGALVQFFHFQTLALVGSYTFGCWTYKLIRWFFFMIPHILTNS